MKIFIYALISASIGALAITAVACVQREWIVEGNAPRASINMTEDSSRAEMRAEVRTVTAYTLGNPAETDDTPCTGATGENLCELTEQGMTICASNEFPLGTILLVDDIECVVKDRMNKRYATRIDIAMLDRDEALAWGKREVAIKIIK